MQMCMSRFEGALVASLTKSFLLQLHAEAAHVRAKALKGIAAMVEENAVLLCEDDII